MPTYYCVAVTYGTHPKLADTFARVPCPLSAEKLKALAIEKGYRDATICEETERAPSALTKDATAPGRSQAHSRRPDRQARGVHDLRSQPEAPVAR